MSRKKIQEIVNVGEARTKSGEFPVSRAQPTWKTFSCKPTAPKESVYSEVVPFGVLKPPDINNPNH